MHHERYGFTRVQFYEMGQAIALSPDIASTLDDTPTAIRRAIAHATQVPTARALDGLARSATATIGRWFKNACYDRGAPLFFLNTTPHFRSL